MKIKYDKLKKETQTRITELLKISIHKLKFFKSLHDQTAVEFTDCGGIYRLCRN